MLKYKKYIIRKFTTPVWLLPQVKLMLIQCLCVSDWDVTYCAKTLNFTRLSI